MRTLIALGAMIAVTGCAATVHPTAQALHVKTMKWGPNTDEMDSFLLLRGFQNYDKLHGMAGYDVCAEKARDGALTGVDVVRFCRSQDGRFRVLHFNTQGPLPTCYEFDPERAETRNCPAKR